VAREATPAAASAHRAASDGEGEGAHLSAGEDGTPRSPDSARSGELHSFDSDADVAFEGGGSGDEIVIHDEWAREQEEEVDELFEKEMATLLPPAVRLQVCFPGAERGAFGKASCHTYKYGSTSKRCLIPSCVQSGLITPSTADMHSLCCTRSSPGHQIARMRALQSQGPAPRPVQPSTSAAAASGGTQEAPVAFRVRLRKQGARGDVDSNRIEIPASSAIASNLRARRVHETEERKELKKLVLAAERSQAAEERDAAAATLAAARAAEGKQSGRGSRLNSQRGKSGFRLDEESFHDEVRNVRGAL
jgi:hypothetical protein